MYLLRGIFRMKKINIFIAIIAELIYSTEPHKSLFYHHSEKLRILRDNEQQTGYQPIPTHAKLGDHSGQSLIGKRSSAILQAQQNHINNILITLFTRDTQK